MCNLENTWPFLLDTTTQSDIFIYTRIALSQTCVFTVVKLVRHHDVHVTGIVEEDMPKSYAA